MSNNSVLLRRQQLPEVVEPDRPVQTYMVTLTADGEWNHAPGSDFLFAYIKNDWPDDLKSDVRNAFKSALSLSSRIKTAVRKTSGEDVVNGLYLLDQTSMTKAMNSIDGMGQTRVIQESQKGSGTAATINGRFFSAILGGLGGDVAPLMQYLTTGMGDVQAQTRQSTVTQNFGTVIGMISVMPVLNIPITTFQYVYSTSSVSSWFVKVTCGSVEHQSYDYAYTVVEYNYDPESK